MYKSYKYLLVFHGLFTIISLVVLNLPNTISQGWKIFFLVLLYNLTLPIFAKIYKQNLWLKIWTFVLPLSIWQIFPDWFLSAQLNVLVFPEDGFLKIGTVSAYMAGLWTIPMFLILYFACQNKELNGAKAYFTAGLVALVIFGTSEETSSVVLGSWYAQNVLMFDHIAVYVIFPEILLGISAYYAFLQTKDKIILYKIIASFFVMILYFGNVCFFYFLIEKII